MLPTILATLTLAAGGVSGHVAVFHGTVVGVNPAASPAGPILRSPPRHADDLALLRDGQGDVAARAAAARRLLAATDPDVQRTLVTHLVPDAELVEVRGILVREVRGMATAPGWLAAPLGTLAGGLAPADQGPVIEALGSIRTRESVRLLLSFTTPPATAVVRDAAFSGLARLTGRSDLGRDAEAWRAWFADVEWRSEAEWLRTLAEGLAQASDRAGRDRDRWITRTLEAMRKAYVEESSQAERAAMLASFLRDELGPMRRLGVELLNRELANARIPDENVSRAALNLLRDPHPDLRLAGADLVSILNPPGAGSALTSALLTENDPAVAAALLRSAALTPTATVRPVVMRWLATPGPAQRPAMDAAAVLVDRGLIDPNEVRDGLLGSIRMSDLSVLPGSGLRLLASLGTEDDRNAVASQLGSTLPSRRVQAAEALAGFASYLPRVIEAASQDPALFVVACRGIAAHDATVEGFLSALTLPTTGPEARREGLLLIVERMDRRDLLTAARMTTEPSLRELVLSRLTAVPLRAPMGPDGIIVPEPTVIGGLLMLAYTRMELKQPAGALAAIEALSPVREFLDTAECDRLRTMALLWLNRIDEAAAIGAPMSAWLDGLDRCIGLAHATDVLDAIDRRFSPPFRESASRPPAEDLARLRSLRGQIVPPMGPPAPTSESTRSEAPPRTPG